MIKENNLLVKQLIDFGLGEKEARIYLTLLKMGDAGVTEISESSGVNRSSTYVVLESLKNKGLVKISEGRTIQSFVAMAPDLLLYQAQNRSEEAEAIKNKINDVMPQLKALHKETKNQPRIMIYEGKEAVKEAYYNIALLKTESSVDSIMVYENPIQEFNYMPEGYMEHDFKERQRLGIKMYALYPASKKAHKVEEDYRKLGSKDEFVFVNQKNINSDIATNLTIAGDEVWFDSPKKSYCINIKNQEIADTLRSLFQTTWEQTKKLNKDNE